MRFYHLVFIFLLLNTPTSSAKQYDQDTLNQRYLTSKNRAIAFLDKITPPSFEIQNEKVALHIQNQDDVSKSAYLVQLCKRNASDVQSEAIDSLLQVAHSLLTREKCQMGLGEVYFYLGVRAVNKKQTPIIHSSFTEAARHFSLANHPLGEIYTYTKLANYYSKNKNFELAEQYNQILLELIKTIDNTNVKEMVYLNVANCYNEQSDIDQAIIYYRQLEESIQESNNTRRLKPLYNNLGAAYIQKKEWRKAGYYLNKSLAIKKNEKDSIGLFSTYQNLFRISLSTDERNEATKYYDLLSELSQKINVPEELLLEFKFNSTEYKILTDTKLTAAKSFRNYVSHKDSIQNAVFSDKIIELEQDFKVQQLDKEVKLLQQKEALSTSRVHNLMLGIGFAIALVIILLVNGFYMKRQWAKLIRSEEQLQIKQKEICRINKQLEGSNKSKDQILSVIGHDLRGPVGGLKELIELYMELPEFEPNDIENLLKTARESSTSTYHLLENLLTWANSQRGQISFNPVKTPIKPLVKNCIQLLDSSINTKAINFKITIPDHLVINVDINMIKVIIRNLVSNSIKYSPEKSLIHISATEHSRFYDLSVSDEGIGISEQEANRILNKNETYNLDNDQKVKGTGLGLVLCQEFIAYHNGIICIKPNTKVGTTVHIRIPKNLKKLTLADSKSYRSSSVM